MAKSKKIDKDMGFRLKKARLDQKLTYDELSEMSGVSSRYIKEIENHGNIFVADVLKAGFRLSLIRRNFKNCLMHPKGYCSKYCPKCSLHSIFPPYQVSMFSLV